MGGWSSKTTRHNHPHFIQSYAQTLEINSIRGGDVATPHQTPILYYSCNPYIHIYLFIYSMCMRECTRLGPGQREHTHTHKHAPCMTHSESEWITWHSRENPVHRFFPTETISRHMFISNFIHSYSQVWPVCVWVSLAIAMIHSSRMLMACSRACTLWSGLYIHPPFF